MFKKKTNKFLAMAFCAAVVSGLYAAPVMAAEATQKGDANTSNKLALNEQFELKSDSNNSSFKVWNYNGSITLDMKDINGKTIFSANPASGAFTFGDNIRVWANGQFQGIKLFSGSTPGVDNTSIVLDALTGDVKAKTFNGITLTKGDGQNGTIKDNIYLNGINITDKLEGVTGDADIAGITRDAATETTIIEGGVSINKNGSMTKVTSINGIGFGGSAGNELTNVGSINGVTINKGGDGKISIGNINLTDFYNNTNNAINDLKNQIGSAGGETTLESTDKNINVEDKDENKTDKNHKYEVSMSKNPEFDSVKVGTGDDQISIGGGNITVGTGDKQVSIGGGKVSAEVGDFKEVNADKGNIGGVNMEGGKVTAEDVIIKDGDKETSLKDVATDIGNLEQSIAGFDSRINKIDDKINKVGAMAAAIANLRTMGYDPAAPTEIAVGVGQYRNETGAALGFFHYPNRDFMLSLSVSTSGEEVMGGIGATWKFGRKSPEAIAQNEAAKAEKAKLAKAEALKKAAEEARLVAQQERHVAMIEK